MDVFQAIRTRRSIRHYLDRPVEEEKLRQVLEAARLAPSAKNRQEWVFVVVQYQETRKKLSIAACGQPFVAEAPVVIVGCSLESDYVMPGGQPGYVVDLAIAIDHMTLMAVSLGLGTCWIGAFYEEQVKEILYVPESIRVVGLLTLGYPDHQPSPTYRKRLDEIVRIEKWE
ncbi:nitroreductase family protein [bacterium]|nr:nitroreductase family protein [bacterium]